MMCDVCRGRDSVAYPAPLQPQHRLIPGTGIAISGKPQRERAAQAFLQINIRQRNN